MLRYRNTAEYEGAPAGARGTQSSSTLDATDISPEYWCAITLAFDMHLKMAVRINTYLDRVLSPPKYSTEQWEYSFLL